MNKYAILLTQGHNRVFYNTSKKLAVCELDIVIKRFTNKDINIKQEDIAGISYVTFCIDFSLNEDEIIAIKRLSFIYAFFKVENIKEETYLKPILIADEKFMPNSLSSILKYTGKTNELFTRMLMNVALYSSNFYKNTNIKLLDPIAGKGTTLYEALMYGYDAYGVEVSGKVALEAYHFMKKFLEIEKYKHKLLNERVSGANKKFRAKRYTIQLAKDKEKFKQNPNIFEIIAGNSMHSEVFFKKNMFNIIVGDLPYGVQHGNISGESQSEFTRNPEKLIQSCGGSWYSVLKKGGAIALSWNSFVLSREKFKEILESFGFKVLDNDIYKNFEHRVDNAIKRDIIVAIK